jgi:hypothetical protein
MNQVRAFFCCRHKAILFPFLSGHMIGEMNAGMGNGEII